MQRQSSRFESIEELCQHIDAMGWDSDVLQLDRNSGQARFSGCLTPRMVLSRFDFGGKVHQRAMPMQGFHTFGLLTSAQQPVKYSGLEMDLGELSCMSLDHGLDAISEAGFSGFTVALRDDLLQQVAARHDLAPPDSPGWKWRQGPLVSKALLVAGLRQRLIACFADETTPVADGELEVEFALQVLTLGQTASGSAPARLPSRLRARQRALAYLRSNRRENVTVRELCDVAACSISTLERAFLEEFGVTPKRYILQEKLSGARRALLEAPPETSITDVASDWSFNHMGKFASDYRQAYGELPSATRRSAR